MLHTLFSVIIVVICIITHQSFRVHHMLSVRVYLASDWCPLLLYLQISFTKIIIRNIILQMMRTLFQPVQYRIL